MRTIRAWWSIFRGLVLVATVLVAVTGAGAVRASADAVRQSLENLPNGVISHSSTDITGTPPAAVTVSQQANGGTVTKTGTIGQGEEGSSGAGLGCAGLGDSPSVGQHAAFGPEYTVTFSTNPGILKSIELDTREINNPGSPDYWVANTRQGQFSSRYSNNLGRVNTLKYGSKFLYTNSDWDEAGKAQVDTWSRLGARRPASSSPIRTTSSSASPSSARPSSRSSPTPASPLVLPLAP